MREFDRYNYEVRTRRVEIPTENPLPERPDLDSPARKSIMEKPVVRFLALVLLAAFALYLPYALFVHPVDKLKLHIMLGRNFTMVVRGENGLYSAEEIVKVDGNLVSVGSKYYELKDDTIYVHQKDYNGVWRKRELSQFELEWETGGTSGLDMDVLLDRRNYEYTKKGPCSWRLKKDVCGRNMPTVYVGRKFGKLAFVWYQNGIEYSIRFKAFGTTHLKPFWKT